MFIKLRNAALLLLGVAICIRIGWALIEPAASALLVVTAISVLLALLFRRSE